MHGPLNDGVGFRCGETGGLAGPYEVDARLRIDGLHFPRQHFGIGADLFIKSIGRRLRQCAHIEMELTVLGNHVGGDAAADQTGRQGRIRNRKAIVALFDLCEAIRDLADVYDQASGVLDGVYAASDITRMRLASVNRTTEPMRPLVRDDGLHGGGFTDHATGGPDAVILQIPNQTAHTQTAYFFVITQRIVQRSIQTIAVEGGDEFRRLGEDDADESFHVGRATREKLAVPLGNAERIGIPILTVHRNDVGVAGQDQSGFWGISQRGKEIGLLSRRVLGEPYLRAMGLQIIANPFDQIQIGIARDGREADQPVDHGADGRAGLGTGRIGFGNSIHDGPPGSKRYFT